jgi:hypothetical protein
LIFHDDFRQEIIMSQLTTLPNIFFSTKDNTLVINKEPSPNRQYKVPIIDNPRRNLTLKMVGDKLAFNKGGYVQKIGTKRTFEQIESNNEVVQWLHKRCPDLSIVDEMNETNREIIIKGYVQSGKTSFMLCTALKYMFGPESMSSVIILRNATGDHTQISSRLRGLKHEISEHLQTKDASNVLDFKVLDGKITTDEFNASMDGTNPQIFVVLGNGSRLKIINKLMQTTSNPRFALFIDEADSNDTGENKRTDELGYLKQTAKALFYISATILDIGMRDEVITCDDDNETEIVTQTAVDNVYMLSTVPNYMGLEKLIHRTLPEKAIPCNKNEDNPFTRDPNLMDFISKFSRFEPHDVKMFGLKHPQHCLISCGSVISPQKKIFSVIAKTDCAVILYNGEGIDLYHESLIGKRIVIATGGGKGVAGGKKCDWHAGAHSFNKSIGIAEMIQWLKNNGGVQQFPRIITISGKLAGRGISFTSSDYGEYLSSFSSGCMPQMMGWRLTSMYYVPSPMTSQPNIMQAIGRVCCVVRDNIPTYIYTNEDVFTDLRKAYWTQEELVIRARAIQEGNSMDLVEAIKKIRMNKSKLSKRRLTVTGVKKIAQENTVEWFEDDGGFNLQETYNNVENVPGDEWEHYTGDVIPVREVNELIMEHKEYDRLTTKMFPQWANNSTNISGFMQQLDPNKLYTTAELKEHCLHNSIRMIDIVMDKSGKSNKYGSIMQKTNGGYKLYPELINHYNKFF